MLSTFMTSVLIGRITDPVSRNSRIIVLVAMSAATSGTWSSRLCLKSMNSAVGPPTWLSAVTGRRDRADRTRGVLSRAAERLVHRRRLHERHPVAERLRPRHGPHAVEPADLRARLGDGGLAGRWR